jgi:hypothetical protein
VGALKRALALHGMQAGKRQRRRRRRRRLSMTIESWKMRERRSPHGAPSARSAVVTYVATKLVSSTSRAHFSPRRAVRNAWGRWTRSQLEWILESFVEEMEHLDNADDRRELRQRAAVLKQRPIDVRPPPVKF